MKREDLVLLVQAAEKILAELEITKETYPKISEAVTFCRNWIDGIPVDEGQIYAFLDDEDEEDLARYYIYADDEREKRNYGMLLGVVSCVAVAVLEENMSPIPQFLSGVDSAYYHSVVEEVRNVIACDVINPVATQKVDIDILIAKIREGEDVMCPKCGELLYYQANGDLSRIYCVYCEKCRYSSKMTYK